MNLYDTIVMNYEKKIPCRSVYANAYVQKYMRAQKMCAFCLMHIWSNFMRMHIDKKLCHFFMVNLSSLLTLLFIKIAWGLFLLLTFKFLINN